MERQRKGLGSLALTAGCIVTLGCAATATTRYVDKAAPSGGDGTSWANAYHHLSPALEDAETDPGIDEIWVAAASYSPSPSTVADREEYFPLVSGVALYGGFPPDSYLSSPGMASRDPQLHTTTLSGDVDDDGTSAGNSYTVVFASNVTGALLDGFRIVDGNADGTGTGTRSSEGGGLFISLSEVELRSCEVRRCLATHGAGALIRGSEVRIWDSLFQSNEASGTGGAIFAKLWGQRNPVPGELCIGRSRFISNSADDGGAIALEGTAFGLHSSVLNGNQATYRGGGIHTDATTGTLGNLTIVNCSAGWAGGGIAMLFADTYELGNSILWDNTAPLSPQFANMGGTISSSYNCVEGLVGSGLEGTGSFDLDPRFVDPLGDDGVAGNGDDDHSVAFDSPCIRAGDTDHLFQPPCFTTGPGGDVTGVERTDGVDVGAYTMEELGIALCFGDGSGTPCPCGNVSAPGSGEGCQNTWYVGAKLVAAGTPSVSVDNFGFVASGIPGARVTRLLCASSLVAGGAGAPFGDGLKCIGGGLILLATGTSDAAGVIEFGPGLGVLGGWSPGETRYFQARYQDPVGGGVCGTGFNLTPAVAITFVP